MSVGSDDLIPDGSVKTVDIIRVGLQSMRLSRQVKTKAGKSTQAKGDYWLDAGHLRLVRRPLIPVTSRKHSLVPHHVCDKHTAALLRIIRGSISRTAAGC
jgi:hypothetical protein